MVTVIIALLLVAQLWLDRENQPLSGKWILSDRLLAQQLCALHALNGKLLLLKELRGFLRSHLKEVAKVHQLSELKMSMAKHLTKVTPLDVSRVALFIGALALRLALILLCSCELRSMHHVIDDLDLSQRKVLTG